MERINISKAITSPHLPTSFENVDLYHIQSLTLITRVNQSCNNWLSQHYDSLSSCGSASYLDKRSLAFPCSCNRTGVEEAPAFPQGFFPARIYLLLSRNHSSYPALLPLLGARRHPWVAHHP